MIRYKTMTITPLTLEASLRETPMTASQQADLEAQMRRSASDMLTALTYMMLGIRPPASSRALLEFQREDLKARRRKVFQSLVTLRATRPMATLIVPKGSTRPEEWTLQPPEETAEETRARNLLADLTVELRRVLLQLADLQGMTDPQRAQMLQREMAL
jgi:hypothetical protein